MSRALATPVSVNRLHIDRDPVADYLDELNVLWKQAEEELVAMHVSVPIEVEVKSEYGGCYDAGNGLEPGWLDTIYLGWRKLAKDWRICVGVLTNHLDGEKPTCDWKTIAESPKEYRIELAEHYAKLKAKVKEARVKLVPQAKAAIASLKQTLGEEPAKNDAARHKAELTELRHEVADAIERGDATIASIEKQFGFRGVKNVARRIRDGHFAVAGVIESGSNDNSKNKALANELLAQHRNSKIKLIKLPLRRT
jgi:hypothetical protein